MNIWVYSGSSIRASYQIGVTCGLIDSGEKPDMVIGISGGAIVSMMLSEKVGDQDCSHEFVDWKRAGADMSQLWINNVTGPESLLEKKGFFKLAKSILKKEFDGLYDNQPIKDLISENLRYSNIVDSALPCITGAVNFDTGKIRYKRNDDFGFVGHTIASTAIPFVFPMSRLNGKKYIDGGIIDSTPLKEAFNHNPTRITCILASPTGLKEGNINEGSLSDYISRIIDIILVNNLDNDIKEANFINELLAFNNKINLKNGYLSKRNVPIRIIRPEKPLNVKISDFTSLDVISMVNRGYRDATK